LSREQVTVVIPAYNRAHYLRQALDSLCQQGLKREEYVVAISDDASPDNTPEVVDEYRDKLQIVYQRNPENLGHIINFTRAAELCHTPYLSFLPDDDLIAPGQLERALALLETRKSAVLVASLVVSQAYPGAPVSGVHGMFLKGNVETSYTEPYVWDAAEWMALALVNTPLMLPGSVFRFDAFMKCETWKSYPMWHDRLMLAEMVLHGDIVSSPWIGGYFRAHNQQLSRKLYRTHVDESRRVSEAVLNLCRANNIEVVDFWIERICSATPEERVSFLRMLHADAPPDVYETIRSTSEKRLNVKLHLGFRMDEWGVPRPVAEFLRTIDRRLRKAN
jgi:glycosyltransferase involved in cell wall biosynthesis